jgi:hypothetical protein
MRRVFSCPADPRIRTARNCSDQHLRETSEAAIEEETNAKIVIHEAAMLCAVIQRRVELLRWQD